MNNNEKLSLVVSWCVEKHKGQFRNNDQYGVQLPYIVHPIQVMSMVAQIGFGTFDNLAAAVCHDILEDTNTSYEELTVVIGEKAANIVKELTFVPPKGISKEEKSILKHEYLLSFEQKSIEALVIKIIDRLCNVKDFCDYGSTRYAEVYYHKADCLWSIFAFSLQRVNKISSGSVDKIYSFLSQVYNLSHH